MLIFFYGLLIIPAKKPHNSSTDNNGFGTAWAKELRAGNPGAPLGWAASPETHQEESRGRSCPVSARACMPWQSIRKLFPNASVIFHSCAFCFFNRAEKSVRMGRLWREVQRTEYRPSVPEPTSHTEQESRRKPEYWKGRAQGERPELLSVLCHIHLFKAPALLKLSTLSDPPSPTGSCLCPEAVQFLQ